MAEISEVLKRCDPALLDLSPDSEQPDCEAAQMVLYLTESRRVQKVLWRQLFVLDSMMSLLEGVESAQELMTEPCPHPPEGGAHGRWKALKMASKAAVDTTEDLLRTLQDRLSQILNRRQTLKQLVQRLHAQKEQHEQVKESLQKAQNALHICERQMTWDKLKLESVLRRLVSWQHLRYELLEYISAVQDVMQINLLSFNQSELCMELRPRPSSSENLSSNELEHLKLSVTWSDDEHFKLQVHMGMAGLADDYMSGPWSEVSAALLEVMQCYTGQAELLWEIQSLRSSFAIDWRPAQRLLVYLKSASLVCNLKVEDGYPSRGRARLQSVCRDGHSLEMCDLQPPQPDLTLTEWVVFLCSSPIL
ncbi:uncharacterized protein si:dkey-225f5.4 [Thalassophryne amazonica]|uniref:uncharacterized protein si:dkey-225f5.4 n=1 Tax=Thalassophryne amazonica TaxID=390379 RepID=UPI001470BC40|nr:uncharacterized protein si:dkey-225f5.4 [Thalassophryne amazonica]